MLYLLYDNHCGLCSKLTKWIIRQKLREPLTLVGWDTGQARRMFPTLVTTRPAEEIIMVSSSGEVWKNEKAWVMVLYALADYATLARRMAHPRLLPLVRQTFVLVSKERHAVSRLFGLAGEDQMAEMLNQIAVPACQLGSKENDGCKIRGNPPENS